MTNGKKLQEEYTAKLQGMQEMDLSEGEWNQCCVYLQELATAMTELTKEGPQRNPARANTTRQWRRCQQCIGKQTSNHHREEGRWNNYYPLE